VDQSSAVIARAHESWLGLHEHGSLATFLGDTSVQLFRVDHSVSRQTLQRSLQNLALQKHTSLDIGLRSKSVCTQSSVCVLIDKSVFVDRYKMAEL
jgi:hypothetical protein